MPMLVADAAGVATLVVELDLMTIGGGANDIVGQGLIVHKDPDDFTTQPTGNSGARVPARSSPGGCGAEGRAAWRRIAAAAALAALIAGCSASMKEEIELARCPAAGLVAQLRSPTSAVTGSVRIVDFRDGVQVQLSVNNLYPGPYRDRDPRERQLQLAQPLFRRAAVGAAGAARRRAISCRASSPISTADRTAMSPT